MDARKEAGDGGERIAAEYLRLAGYSIIETNLRIGHLEIDIIAGDGDCLVFVEVRTRRTGGFGDSLSSVTAAKVARMRRAAGRYLSGTRAGRRFTEVRMDVIGIDLRPFEGRMDLRHVRGIS